ncbi:hypothetical protein NDU88_001418 [Pleurodeles waltl]|uniref:Uncharacterized protein n=1 Tax=Pleurodeles waltl TaxID=8319 RepID=A0AAV7Q722_PLEWA|nr:hypothetical protein NDU88_001418 [Pleurodeles waltl]
MAVGGGPWLEDPGGPEDKGRPPRPVVAKLLHYRDQDIMLQRARDVGPFTLENGKVDMFPDYTAAVQSKRFSYLSVKKALWEEGIRYALLFPSKLKIMGDDRTHFCQMLKEAWDWLESHKGGKPDCAKDAHGASGCRRKKRRSWDRPTTDLLRRPT